MKPLYFFLIKAFLTTVFYYPARPVADTIPIALDDYPLSSCPGVFMAGDVSRNDTLPEDVIFSLVMTARYGSVQLDSSNGKYTYSPFLPYCGRDTFWYQVCSVMPSQCDSAKVVLSFEDEEVPVFQNLPLDLTLDVMDEIPPMEYPEVSDNCPAINLEVSTEETITCGVAKSIVHTWTVSDNCNNQSQHQQKISVVDQSAPDIFRVHTLSNGNRILGGKVEMTGQYWKRIPFPISFEEPPLIFTQLVTEQDTVLSVVQVQSVTESGFQMRLRKETDTKNYIPETVTWIALERGIQMELMHWEADTIGLTHGYSTLSFVERFNNIPHLFTSLQTTNDETAATVRQTSVRWESGRLRIQEENSTGENIAHDLESVAYWAIDNSSTFENQSGESIGEIGRIRVGSDWQFVPFSKKYSNPVMLANSLTFNDVDASAVRIRNLSSEGFEIAVKEWSYLDGNHGEESISWLVVEGSAPAESVDFCSQVGNGSDATAGLLAMDNTGERTAIQYRESAGVEDGQSIVYRIWSTVDNCGNEAEVVQGVFCPFIATSVTVLLQGAMQEAGESNLMSDYLRQQNLLPVQEPYSGLPGFAINSTLEGTKIRPDLLQIEGTKAVVDWVVVELRSNFDPAIRITSALGLVLRDGTVIGPDGSPLILFPGIPAGQYYLAIRHRNHLCMRTRLSYRFEIDVAPAIDFSIPENVAGTQAGIKLGNQLAMWAGDINQDDRVVFQGPQNDIFDMFFDVLSDSLNIRQISNFVTEGYYRGDINMDGKVIYQGPGNDRAVFLFNTILKIPSNGDFLPNFILEGCGGE